MGLRLKTLLNEIIVSFRDFSCISEFSHLLRCPRLVLTDLRETVAACAGTNGLLLVRQVMLYSSGAMFPRLHIFMQNHVFI